MKTPQHSSVAGANGRTESGQFAKGNRAGLGNPHAKRAQLLRSAVLDAVSESDIKGVIQKLVSLAKDGDVQAARLLLDRACGKLSVCLADSDDPQQPTDDKPGMEQKARGMLLSMRGASNVG